MSSILKVDQIQLSNGNTPTAKDLGLNTTGSVLQVQSNQFTNNLSSSSGQISGGSVSITPSSTSSKILFLCTMAIETLGSGSDRGVQLRLFRDSTNIKGSTYNLYMSSDTTQRIGEVTMQILDSPNTTSAVAYSFDFGPTGSNSTARAHHYGKSVLTVMEIAG